VKFWLQSYRALTHVVVHASLPHVLFNMYSFASVGQRLERLVGSVGLLQVM
jgi:membrane associated rhomboid family serine protease